MTAGAGSRRVALVAAASDAGGAERLMETLAARLPRHGADPVMAAPEDSQLVARWQARGFETCALPAFGRVRRVDQVPRIVAEITRRLRALDVAIVHSHGGAAHIRAGLAARRLGRPAIYHAHDVFETRWSLDGAMQRFALRVPAARVIASSATVAASLRGRVAPGTLEVIFYGVDSEIVEPVAIPAGPLVVFCGRLQQWKGPHHFIAAAARVHAQRADVRFAIVGGTLFGLEPEYPHLLARQVAEADLDHVFEFVGHVADARPWMRAAALLVHCSDSPEPFGLVMAEAMMQERPVAAFRLGGAAEIVVDGETGCLVAPRDTAALASAILEIIGDPARAMSMGASGRRRALQYFNADDTAAAVGRLYDAVSSAHE